jgi:HEAT repeat protein
LHTAALDPSRSEDERLRAAEALAGLGDPRGVGILYAIALAPSIKASPTWGGHNPAARVGAAGALAELGDPRGIALLHDLAEDTALGHWTHLEVARTLARLGDPRASDLLHAAALDSGGSGEDRLRAAEALAGLGDPRGAGTLYAIALDPSVQPWKRTMTGYGRPPTPRVRAAEALAGLGDPRALDLLRKLTHTRGTFDGFDRKSAHEALERLRARPDDKLTWMRTLMNLGQVQAESRKGTM